MIARTLASLFLLCTVALAPALVRAQDGESAAEPVRLIELTSVEALKKGDKWLIKVKGKASKLPAGSVIEIILNRSYHKLERFRFELGESRRFDEKFESAKINGEVDKLYVSAAFPLAQQTRAVQKKIASKPDDFPMDQEPWRVGFGDKPFSAGSKADLQRRAREVQAFFKDNMKELVKLNGHFEALRSEAVAKTRFTSGDDFDSEKWLRVVEAEVRDPLREVQKAILAAQDNISFSDVVRDVGYVQQLAASVAKRSYDRSLKLHAEMQQSPHPEDVPKEIDVKTTKKATKRNMGRLIERICDSRGIDMKELE